MTGPIPPLTPIRRALISVSDKTGLAAFGKALAAAGVEILSTGGSARALIEAGVPVTEVASHTGFPEIMDGRVKTLHPKIHGGILARRDLADHRAAMSEHDIAPIDLVAVNLYPFEATLASGADAETCVENIDIGGPAMVRAAAKNHGFVTVVTDPADYDGVVEEMRAHDGATGVSLRTRLAAAAFAHTAAYDAAIARWMQSRLEERFPDRLTVPGRLSQTLRYGENPHQLAALYTNGDARPGVATAEQIQGKALSYNNLNDTDAAFEAVAEFTPSESNQAAVAIVKHANPCGIALGETQVAAYTKALACDPLSAYGGIVALNRPLDAATATEIAKIFIEVVIAPEIEADARAILADKKNLRVLITGAMADPGAPGLAVKSLAGGLLVQSRDNGRLAPSDLKIVTKRIPSHGEIKDMLFAFQVAKHVKSNAIVLARDRATLGIGAGQMSRVDATKMAAWKMHDAARTAGNSVPEGVVAASDAFFPFTDGLMAVIEAGAQAVIQPGGSLRDREVIDAADEAGIAMVFTGMRHFRH